MQATPPTHLSVLSFNMQVGIGTRRYSDYVTRGWRHLLPSDEAEENLTHIAELLSDYDIIGLQEIDAGSRRSRYHNQIQMLAEQAGLNYWSIQVNRSLGRMAQHGLGIISRYRPYSIVEHRLPGRLPGRGALVARFGDRQHSLMVVVTHLSLGAGSRAQQLEAISHMIADEKHVIVMGDTNCSGQELMDNDALARTGLRLPEQLLCSFPSWQPKRDIDHILTSPSLTVAQTRVVDAQLSDHRPVAMQIDLPDALGLALAGKHERAANAPLPDRSSNSPSSD